MEAAGFAIPAWVKEMLDSGKDKFYKREKGVWYYYDPASKDYKEVPMPKPEIILLPSLQANAARWSRKTSPLPCTTWATAWPAWNSTPR